MAFFLVESGINPNARRIQIPREQKFYIGKDPGNQLVIDYDDIYPQHACLTYELGRYWLEDLNGGIGTSVDGSRIKSKILLDGAVVHFGRSFRCRFVLSETDLKTEDDASRDDELETFLEVPLELAPIEYPEAVESSGSVPNPPRLIPVESADGLKEYPLDKPEIHIGRADGNDIVLKDRTISRTHCKIVRNNDSYRIIDLGSNNGISVNRENVHDCALHSGDIVRIGVLEFTFSKNRADVHPQARQRKVIQEYTPEPWVAPDLSGNNQRIQLYLTIAILFLSCLVLLYVYLAD